MKKKTWIIIGSVVAGIGLIGSLAGGPSEGNKEIAVSGDVAYYAAMGEEKRKEQCEDKYVEVTGTVTYVGYDLIYIGDSLEDEISIHCRFENAEEAEGIKSGDTVKVRGKCTSCYASTMSIYECKLIESTPATQGTENTNTSTTTNSTTPSSTTKHTTNTSTKEMVWVPINGGERYHRHSGCSQMKNPRQITKEEAIRQGFTPCGRCY